MNVIITPKVFLNKTMNHLCEYLKDVHKKENVIKCKYSLKLSGSLNKICKTFGKPSRQVIAFSFFCRSLYFDEEEPNLP